MKLVTTETTERLLEAAREMRDFCYADNDNVQDMPDALWLKFTSAIDAAESQPSLERDALRALELMLIADTAISENIGSKSDQAMQRISAIDNARAVLAKAERKG